MRAVTIVLVMMTMSCAAGDKGGADLSGAGGGGGGSGGGGSVGAGGGGGGTTELDIYQSGTRIKMKVLSTADGATSFQGWFDSQLQVDCQFATATDGQSRCVPVGAYVSPSFFSDAGCTNRLAYLGCAGANAPAFAVANEALSGAACTGAFNVTQARVYAVAGVHTGATYAGSPASCSMASAGTLASYTFFSLGGESAPAMFAAGTIAVQ